MTSRIRSESHRHIVRCTGAGFIAALLAACFFAIAGPAAHARVTQEAPPPPATQAPPAPVDATPANTPPDAKPNTAATTAPAPEGETEAVTPLTAEVTAVAGTVDRADRGIAATAAEGWTPVKVGDRLAAGTQIRTGRRSSVDLRFGEGTYISVTTPTYASIDAFYRSATAETVRIGLGYGKVRGGSFEGAAHSDVVVDAPTATLAKRGTDGWEIAVEPGTGRFTIALAREGLVEAIRRVGQERADSRLVRPGEYATENNIASLWIRQAVFDRNVTSYESSWVTAADAAWSSENTTGMNVVAPGLGADGWSYAAPGYGTWVMQQLGARSGGAAVPGIPVRPARPLDRPEGNFGTRP
jgi:hypothetical protein